MAEELTPVAAEQAYTVAQAAKVKGVSTDTIRQAIHATDKKSLGELPQLGS